MNIFSNHAAQQPLETQEVGVDVQNAGLQDLLTAEGQELPGESGAALDGFFDLGGQRKERAAGFNFFHHHAAIADNYPEDVVEVMGDAAGQASNGFHFLNVAEALLQAALA